MRIGLMTNTRFERLTLDRLVDFIVQAERDGFDACWLLELPHYGFDALTAIAVAGRQTNRIGLGTSVVPVYPYHPLALAQHALTAQAATGGRLALGLGLSHAFVVEEMLGLSYAHPARQMRETLSVLRPLVAEGRVDFAGEVFRVKAELHVPGATPFPVLIAALAPRMLHLAGEQADGTITWLAGPRALESHILPRLMAAAGPDRPRPRVVAGLPIAVTDDAALARETAAGLFASYGRMPNYRRLLDLEPARTPGEVAIVGDEGVVERQLRHLAELGVDDFVAALFPVGPDAAASVARTRILLASLAGQ